MEVAAGLWPTNARMRGNPGKHWSQGRAGQPLFNTVVQPNAAWGGGRYGCGGCGIDNSDFINAGSAHSGGINVSMADGSTQWVGDSADLDIWWAMGSKDGGETF